jgi:hypothetical protein
MARKEHPQTRGMASRSAKKAAVAQPPTRKRNDNSVRRMPLKQWLAIPDAPVQRNTERHWREKAKFYLSTLRKAHCTVHMAVTETGAKYKLDSHTRCYGWVNGLTDAVPDYVDVVVYHVKDEEAVIDEYYTLDGTGQGKDAADQLFSAFKQFGIKYDSAFFRGCKGIVSSLKEALWEISRLYEIDGAPANLRKTSVLTCVKFFQEQLRALDAIAPTYGRFAGPPTAAFLLAHFKYTELGKNVADVVEFFRLHQNDAGVKNGKRHDAVYAMTKIMAKKGGGGAGHRRERLSRILACVERFVGPGGRQADFQNGGLVDMENYLIEEHAILAKRGKKTGALTR